MQSHCLEFHGVTRATYMQSVLSEELSEFTSRCPEQLRRMMENKIIKVQSLLESR